MSFFGGGAQSFLSWDSRLWLIGGVNGRESVRWTVDGRKWHSRKIGSFFGERLAAASAFFHDRLIVTGGYDGQGHRNETWLISQEME
jgi:hypothetical protein